MKGLFHFHLPPSDPGAARTSGALAAAVSIAATKKSDSDKVLKGIKDGCNGIIWRNDAQVVRIMLEKRYSETPGVRIEVIAGKDDSA